MLKVSFVSNYYNHHQSSFSKAMHDMGIDYHFIETASISPERQRFGWGEDEKPDYILSVLDNDELKSQCIDIINDSDFVIIGSAPDEFVSQRHKMGRLIFRYSERFYRKGCPTLQIPLRYIKNYFRFNRYKNDYMLCASAFTAGDAALTNSFKHKTYKWGYFPSDKRYDLEVLFQHKRENDSTSILWAGRLKDWKHPEVPVLLAEMLRNEGFNFSLNIIGDGEMYSAIRGMIEERKLSDCVHILGSRKPDEVRGYMEKSDIYLFTSDFNEGWGAVLNESMNSACAVVASHAIGSVPYLIKNRENGFIYHNGELDELYLIVRELILSPDLREKVGRTAYKTIVEEWNAEIAARRLVLLYEDLRKTGRSARFEDGPCSAAPILENDWFGG